ncbi:MAG: glycosyltransferase, partial [bacterium]
MNYFNKANKNLICLFSQTLLPGGTEKQVVYLASSLKKRNFNVIIVVLYPDNIDKNYYKILNKYDIEIYELKGKSLYSFILLIRLLSKKKIDIIFTFLTLPGLIGAIAAKIARVNHIIGNIRSSYLPKSKLIINRLIHNCLNQYTIINNQSGLEKFSTNRFRSTKFILIRNSVESIPDYNDIMKSDKNVIPIIISVGRFEKVKDYYSALHAIKLLANEEISFYYYILGYGSQK